MSGETREDPTGWTVDTLRQAMFRELDLLRTHTDGRLDSQKEQLNERHQAQRDAVLAALASSEKAIDVVRVSAEHRFESVNEFRALVEDLIRTMMPRSESTARWEAMGAKVDVQARTIDDRFNKLELRMESVVSADKGSGQQTQRLYSGIAAAAAVFSIISIIVVMILTR